MKVESYDGQVQVTIEDCEYTQIIPFVNSDLTYVKRKFIEIMSQEFDRAVSKNIGITYPYQIGTEIFYSKDELENWVLEKQNRE